MGEVPNQHDEKPDVGPLRRANRLAPYFAAAAVGLMVSPLMKEYSNGNHAASIDITPAGNSSATPYCYSESEWRRLPKYISDKGLSVLMGIKVTQAKSARMALVKCDDKIDRLQAMNRQLIVEGVDGPCMVLDVKPGLPANPIAGSYEAIAVCIGFEPAAGQEIS